MEISINGKNVTIKSGMNLLEILKQETIRPEGIAIAINDVVISKKEWADKIPKPEDRILIITATAGG